MTGADTNLTPQLLSVKETESVATILENAEKYGNEHLILMCLAELERRPIKRTKIIASQEDKASNQLFQLHGCLNRSFDLSEETARRLSDRTRGFQAHRQPLNVGNIKVAGSQKSGKTFFHRYLSYRLQSEVFNISILRRRASNVIEYQVMGPPRLLTNFIPIAELRPFVSKQDSHELMPGGESFSNFEAAAERYTWLMGQVAPRLQ